MAECDATLTSETVHEHGRLTRTDRTSHRSQREYLLHNVRALLQTPSRSEAGHSHPKDILPRMPRARHTNRRAFDCSSAWLGRALIHPISSPFISPGSIAPLPTTGVCAAMVERRGGEGGAHRRLPYATAIPDHPGASRGRRSSNHAARARQPFRQVASARHALPGCALCTRSARPRMPGARCRSKSGRRAPANIRVRSHGPTSIHLSARDNNYN
jgi:hypothetical protein